MILTPSCLPHQDASKHVKHNLERSKSKFDLRSRSRGDRSRSYCICIDASWWEKHNETTRTSLSLLDQKVFAKTVGDLRWPQMTFGGSPMKTVSWVITEDLSQHHSQWMEMFWCEKEVVKILPIDLTWASHEIDLTSGHEYQKSEI